MEENRKQTTITKNQTANVGKYSYQYVDIAQIHEYLEQNNMKYIQCIKRIDNDDYIMTKRYVDGKWEDEWIQGSRVVQATLMNNSNPAQEQGSALTYARRYSLLMAFGLATEDDDANSLNRNKKEEIASKEQAEQYKISAVINSLCFLPKNSNEASRTIQNNIRKTRRKDDKRISRNRKRLL